MSVRLMKTLTPALSRAAGEGATRHSLAPTGGEGWGEGVVP